MQKLYIAMYHYIRDLKNSRYPNIKGLDLPLFEQQIAFFAQNFNVVTMENVIEAVNNNLRLPENALLLTFDDGYIDHYLTAFPVLKEYNMQGSFFIPAKTFTENKLLDVNKVHFILATANEQELLQDVKQKLDYYRDNDWQYASTEELYEKYAVANRFDTKDTIFIKRILQTVLPEDLRNIIASELFEKYVGIEESKFAKELYMNPYQIQLMKDSGMFIGMHGYSHYWLANIDNEQLDEDINKGLEAMRNFINPNCWVMNYPYGNYNKNVIENVASKGCILALTTNVKVADIDSDSKYELPRLDCNDFPPKSNNWINKLGEN